MVAANPKYMWTCPCLCSQLYSHWVNMTVDNGCFEIIRFIFHFFFKFQFVYMRKNIHESRKLFSMISIWFRRWTQQWVEKKKDWNSIRVNQSLLEKSARTSLNTSTHRRMSGIFIFKSFYSCITEMTRKNPRQFMR